MSASSSIRPHRAVLPLACVALTVLPLRASGVNGMTDRVSYAFDGTQVTSACQRADISSNGRYVAYASQEALLPTDLNGT